MRNIILCGFMGSGKTSVGKILAQKLGLAFYDTDLLIEKNTKMSIPEIFEKLGESYFRELETKTVKSFLDTENNVIALGGGLAANTENHSILKNIGFVILLDCGIEKTLERISGDKNRPLTMGGKEDIIKRYSLRNPIYRSVADIIVDSRGEAQKTAENIISLLEELKII